MAVISSNSPNPRQTHSRFNKGAAKLRGIVASATGSIRSNMKNEHFGNTEQWQVEAWEMFDSVGEQRFITTVKANRIGQAKLYVGKLNPEDELASPEPINEGLAFEIFDALGGTHSARSQLQTRAAINLDITGDCWLIGIPNDFFDVSQQEKPKTTVNGIIVDRLGPDGESLNESGIDIANLNWQIYSLSEVKVDGDKLELKTGKRDNLEIPLDQVYPIRIHRPHPQEYWRADSPTRSSLPVLRELVGLTMHISAQVDSRLAGAGILTVPQSALTAYENRYDINGDQIDLEIPAIDLFMNDLIDAMTTAIQDRSNASAVAPIAISVPDTAVNLFQHITFSSPLDGAAKEMRDESIRRLALGQDIPPELLLGVGSMNHWGAWLVKEEVVTTHVEPVLALVCNTLTSQYLWPVLEAQGIDEADFTQYVIWYDVSHLVQRPNPVPDALVLHERAVISDETIRRLIGFTNDDAPDESGLDPAVQTALTLVSSAPSLAADPGLPALVQQLRQVLETLEETQSSKEIQSGQGENNDDSPADNEIPKTDDQNIEQIDESVRPSDGVAK